mgnify:CR=1 FL=1
MDPEHEMGELCNNLGGCFVDLMSGRYRINPLEPKLWDVDGEDDPEAPAAFREHSRDLLEELFGVEWVFFVLIVLVDVLNHLVEVGEDGEVHGAFNVLSYLSNKLLTEGNTVASIDELYLFLSNPVAIEYIRSFMKRVRGRGSPRGAYGRNPSCR